MPAKRRSKSATASRVRSRNLPVAVASIRPATRGSTEVVTATALKSRPLVIREAFGLYQKDFARLVNASVRSLAEWESGEKSPGLAALKRYAELERLHAGLSTVLGPDSAGIGEWLLQPNPAFENQKPLNVIDDGGIDRIWRMIFEVGSGSPT